MSNRRVPTYLSPTAIAKFRKDPEIFYLDYIATERADRMPQTQAMAIGSAFDAYAKSYLHEKLFGRGNDPKYDFDALFQAQVSEEWRDWAKFHGMYVFDQYTKSGALGDLLTELQQAVNVPKFEVDITGVINNQREPVSRELGAGVVLMGKPDVFYINKHAASVQIDWKVNGYVSKYPKSPLPGYVRLRSGSSTNQRNSGNAHKDAVLVMHNGVLINGRVSLHELDVDWASQLSIYAWLCGLEIGDDFIAGIDQVCCAPTGTEFPDLRFAEHRMRISPDFQRQLFRLAADIWARCHSDWFFREMTKAENDAYCDMLDVQATTIANMDPEFLAMTQRRPSFPKKGV